MTIETISSREVYRNRWMTVREDAIRTPESVAAGELQEETGLVAGRMT
jgi:hypothetical protein